ncbi:MAG: helix-turn-helix domain-containing protein [Cyanobium sp.]
MPDTSNPDPIPALQNLGQVLRRGRESQGLGIAELAGRLNMGQEQLQALEEGDALRLPEPVFVIAQARRVANNLAIDVEVPLQTLRACSQFQTKPIKVGELSPRPPLQPPSATPSPASTAGAGLMQVLQTLGRPALAAGILAAMVAGGSAGWQGWQRQQARQRQPAPSGQATNSSPISAAGGSQLLLRSSQPSWLEVKTASGKSLFRGSFQGERRFDLEGGLDVLAGRPDLVQAQMGSGTSQALGRIDQVRWRRFTAPAP